MTTYYVRKSGADGTGGHDGTTPAKAWLTLTYAFATATNANGHTFYIGAGTYRENNFYIARNTWSIIGDWDGSQTGDAGEVIITSFLTDDSTAPDRTNYMFQGTNINLTLRHLTIIGSKNYSPQVQLSYGFTLADCTFIAWGDCWFLGITPGWRNAINGTIERCRFITDTFSVEVFPPSGATTGDLDLNLVIRNCLFSAWAGEAGVGYTGGHVWVHPATTNTYHSYGVVIYNCTFICAGMASISIDDVGLTSPAPLVAVYNSITTSGWWNGSYNKVFVATTSGSLVEDYNILIGNGPSYGSDLYENVTPGANTVNDGSHLVRLSFGEESSYGANPRPAFMPMQGSPVLSFGSYAGNTLDLLGGPRPGSGNASVAGAVGALERGNSATRETSTVRTGANALKLLGPGYQDFQLPVAAASTTVTVYVQWDATYAGTKPSMQVLNGGECGVADATATATGSSGNWEQLSLNFTPTATGVVTIRLLSSDTNGGGSMFADDFAVT